MRKRKGGRVYGPYRNGRDGWRIIVVAGPGASARSSHVFATEAEAGEFKREALEQLATEAVTVSQAMEQYRQHQIDKGNKPGSIATTKFRLRSFFTDGEEELANLTARRCETLYSELKARSTGKDKARAVDTHRNTLGQVRTFLRWCERKRWVTGNPAGAIEGTGRRRRGKAQLRLGEAKALRDTALAELAAGRDGALAALIALLLGLRAGEIVGLQARDVDNDGRLLWVAESDDGADDAGKTAAARRQLDVPEEAVYLIEPLAAAAARAARGPLFPGRDRHWVLREVKRLCRLAGVPVVTAHGLRGTQSSIAVDGGATAAVVAGALGQADGGKTARRHYIRPEAEQSGRARRAALRLVP